MSPLRLLAVRALIDISSLGKKPKAVLDSHAAGCSRQDRAFLMEIVYGVLRYRLTLEWILVRFLKTPGRLGDFTSNNLRCALYQILFMRVPEWAAVNEAVEIEKSSGNARQGSLVNAVLRNFLRRQAEFVLPLKTGDPASDISLNTSTPSWLLGRWIDRFGIEEARALCDANNLIPELCIRTNTLRTTRDLLLAEIASHGISALPSPFSPEGIVIHGVHAFADLAFAHGLFLVQDEASQLISHLLAPRPGERVLDACAAPGGKATHLAQLMNDTGEVLALEKDPRRLERLSANIRQLGISSVKTRAADFLSVGDIGLFDRILVDAPCSTLGVIRKNPDVKYRSGEKDLRALRDLQTGLLLHAAGFLKPGGRLVYAVCSTEPEEGEEVVASFLKSAADFRIIEPVSGFLAGFRSEGFFRSYPHRHAMDGFFGVILCNRE